MRKIHLSILIIILAFSSCHESYMSEDYPCAFCFTELPEEAYLTINLSLNKEHDSIPIVIYKGLIEDNVIEWEDTATENPYYILVPIENKYTVTAEYKVGDKKIIAVDSDRVFMRKNTTDCDEVCWIIFDGEIDVELKYDE